MSEETIESTSVTTSPVSGKSHTAEAVFLGFTFVQLLFIALWPMALVALVIFTGIGVASKAELELAKDGIRARTPVIVLNFTDQIRALERRGLNSEEIMEQLDARVEQLAQAGYVVIDSRSVLGAPEQAKAEVSR